MADVTTHGNVVRRDRMELLTTSQRIPERVDRLERAAAGGLLGGASVETAIRFGQGAATACAPSTWTSLPGGAVVKTDDADASFRVNADGTFTILQDGWYELVGGVVVSGTFDPASSAQTAIWGRGDDTNVPASFMVREEALAGEGGVVAHAVAVTINLGAGTRVGMSVYQRDSVSRNFVLDKLAVHRIGSGAQGAQGIAGTPGANGTDGAPGAPGAVVVFEQPGDPGVQPHGTMWIDTDASPLTGGTRFVETIVTDPLATNATEAGLISIATGFRVLRISTDRAAWVRLYTTYAKSVADAGRLITVDPTGDHGVALEGVTSAALLGFDCSPVPEVFSMETPPDFSVPYRVKNLGATGVVTVTLTLQVLE